MTTPFVKIMFKLGRCPIGFKNSIFDIIGAGRRVSRVLIKKQKFQRGRLREEGRNQRRLWALPLSSRKQMNRGEMAFYPY